MILWIFAFPFKYKNDNFLPQMSSSVFRSGQMSSWFGTQRSLMASMRSQCHLMPSGYLTLSLVKCKKLLKRFLQNMLVSVFNVLQYYQGLKQGSWFWKLILLHVCSQCGRGEIPTDPLCVRQLVWLSQVLPARPGGTGLQPGDVRLSIWQAELQPHLPQLASLRCVSCLWWDGGLYAQ